MKTRKDSVGFSPEQMDKIISFLKERGGEFKCPVCGQDHFTVNDRLVAELIQGRDVLITGEHYPQIVIHCNNCYFSLHFMAGAILGEDYMEDMVWREDNG